MFTKQDIESQKGKIAIVTGANSGIGFETARVLAEKGAHVIIACRDIEKGLLARKAIEQAGVNGTVESALLDLSDLKSVERFAAGFTTRHGLLDLLVNNAGIAITPPGHTAEGYELQFGVNFLGHFALTGHLYKTLSSTPGSRVVSVSSMGYRNGIIDFDNLKSEKSYEPFQAYSRSKLANLVFALEFDRRIRSAGDRVLSVASQPGSNNTALVRHMSKEAVEEGFKRIGGFMEPWQGALSVLLAAVGSEVMGGDFYEPETGFKGYPVKGTVLPLALDETLGQELWQFAENASGLRFP